MEAYLRVVASIAGSAPGTLCRRVLARPEHHLSYRTVLSSIMATHGVLEYHMFLNRLTPPSKCMTC